MKGFTLIEILIVTLIISIIAAALFVTLNIGQYSFAVSSAKLRLQSELRLAMDWLMRDLRQTISYNIASEDNNPTMSHLKFNTWTWDSATNSWIISGDYIEYNYDAVAQKLTRNFVPSVGDVMVLEFNNIIEPCFYTTYVSAGNPANALDRLQLQSDRKLTLVISGSKLVRGSVYAPYALKTEVKIRNG